MFTGIIERIGTVVSIEESQGQARLGLQTGFTDLNLGESLAVNGVCLTVTRSEPGGNSFFFVSEETLSRTNFGGFVTGTKVNLERALPAHGRLSGHIVQGHVDTVATLLNIQEGTDHRRMCFAMDSKFGKYLVEKGSIAINGVSLTINSLQEGAEGQILISVLIIPHSWEHTNFPQLNINSLANIEVDVLAKYVERLCLYPRPSNN